MERKCIVFLQICIQFLIKKKKKKKLNFFKKSVDISDEW